MKFAFHYNEKGNHTHVAIFVGQSEPATRAKCGDLVMTNEEFELFKTLLIPPRGADFEFIDTLAAEHDTS